MDDKQNLVESIEGLLTSVNRCLKIFHRKCIEEHKDIGLTEQQYLVLKVLNNRGPLKMMELGEILHTSSGSLTVMIDRLVAKEMVERYFLEEDRRVVMVGITKVGAKAIDEFKAGILGYLAQEIDRYDTKKKRRIAAAVNELHEVFEKMS